MSTVRTCRKCGDTKDERLFVHHSRNGYENECKTCRVAGTAEWRRLNPVRALAQRRAHYANNRPRYKDNALRWKHGISLGTYQQMSEQQGHVCAICSEKPHDGILRVDHNQGTGEIRGLLCDTCNRGIGLLKDNTDVLRSAVDYLCRKPTIVRLSA
jgi:hypothetical protein